MQLDIKTFFLNYLVINAICAGVIAFLWRQNRHHMNGLGLWLTSFLLQTTGLTLVILRGTLPDLVTFVISNTLIISGAVILLAGLARFTNTQSPHLQNILLIILFILAQSYFTYQKPNLNARNIVISLALLIIHIQSAWLVLARANSQIYIGARGIGVIFILFCLTGVMRIIVNIVVPTGNDFFQETSMIDGVAAVLYESLVVMLTFGLLLLVNGRLLGELKRDIAERKEMGVILQNSERRLQALVENGLDYISLLDSNGKLLWENPSASNILGYGYNEFIDRNILELLHPDDLEWVSKGFLEIAGNPNSRRQATFRLRHANGNWRWVDAMVSNLLHDPAVNAIVVNYRDITRRRYAENALQKANDQLQNQLNEINVLHTSLRDQAIRDPLTGLYNRRYLNETIERELARAKRDEYPVSVMIIDVDFFKKFNDSYGHNFGDQILLRLSRLLSENIRVGDMACRFGGDEFVVVMPGASLQDAQHRAEVILQKLNAEIILHGSTEISATASIGVSAYPQHGENGDILFSAADIALYQAKQSGRRRVEVWKEL